MGGRYSVVEVQVYRYRCSDENCEYREVTDIPFKSKEHLLTEPLREYAETLNFICCESGYFHVNGSEKFVYENSSMKAAA